MKIQNNKQHTNEFYSYEEAQKILKSHKIQSFAEYQKFIKQDLRFPLVPYKTYSNKWMSWPKFLKNEINFCNYEVALKIIRPLKLKSKKKYYNFVKQNPIHRLPLYPHQVYFSKWETWPKFLNN